MSFVIQSLQNLEGRFSPSISPTLQLVTFVLASRHWCLQVPTMCHFKKHLIQNILTARYFSPPFFQCDEKHFFPESFTMKAENIIKFYIVRIRFFFPTKFKIDMKHLPVMVFFSIRWWPMNRIGKNSFYIHTLQFKSLEPPTKLARDEIDRRMKKKNK